LEKIRSQGFANVGVRYLSVPAMSIAAGYIAEKAVRKKEA